MSAPEAADSRRVGLPRAETLGPFLAQHFRLPVPAQGDAPAHWSPLEQSLHPEDCGSCHPKQLAEWRSSLHAAAWSPGLAGQLVEGHLSRPASRRSCQRCHTPLEEQMSESADGTPSPVFDPALRAQGLVCAGCHVRAHTRYGPPRRPDAPVPSASGGATRHPALPHEGFEAREAFGEARFCASCHQFFDQEGVAGKPVENTFVEWLESPYAARGETCQSCHMPDRAHSWRGIHDPEMVAGAVDISLEAERSGEHIVAALSLTSHGVGHAFPTYVTPRVLLEAWQEGAGGEELPDTRRRYVIGRKIDFRARKELFDTRVLPGRTATLDYAQPRAPGAVALVARVTVDPGFHYRGVFESLGKRLEDSEALRLIAEAHRRTEEARYTLRELRAAIGD